MKLNQRRSAWLIVSVLVSLLAANASATDFPVDWTFGTGFFDLQILQNDTVTWTYAASHTVYEFPDESAFNICDFSLATLVGDFSDSPLTVTFADMGTRYFGCNVGSHCGAGSMKIRVVTASVGLIFEDGFETGGFGNWSTVAP